MAKKYHRHRLNQAIAAACLSVTVVPALLATPAMALDYAITTGTTPITLATGDTLTVTSNGVISGGSTGVAVTSGAIAGSISNSGLIEGGFAGIRITNASDVSGGITNALGATIRGTTNSSGAGIYLSNSTMTGAIVNHGTISGGTGASGTTNFGAGIKVVSNSDISGGITNTGTISGYAGIYIDHSNISGGILNDTTGMIRGTNGSSSAGFGIYLKNSIMTGAIDNRGTISGGNTGILLTSGSDVVGGITNALGATIQGIKSSGAGIVLSNSTMTGAIVNHGTISGGTSNGSAAGIWLANHSDISGGITNNGTISAGAFGIYVQSSDISGGIDNQNGGIISGSVGIRVSSGSNISGGIKNSGTIEGQRRGIFVFQSDISGDSPNKVAAGIDNLTGGLIQGGAAGIAIEQSTFTGRIFNDTGATIQGTNSSGAGIYVTRSTMSGAIVNYGTISGGLAGINPTDFGVGIKVVGSSSDISGGITNTGTISGFVGILVKSNSDISGGIYNNGGIISGQMTGIRVEGSNISGGIKNTGTIEGLWNYGIYVKTGGNISGDSAIPVADGIENSGTGTIKGLAAGIYIDSSNFTGRIFNDTNATIQGIGGTGIGIYLNNSTMTGAILNNGRISGGTGAPGIYVANASDISGGISNFGTIEGGTGILVGTSSNISGGITNQIGGIIRGTGGIAIDLNDASLNATAPNTKIVVTNYGWIDGGVVLHNNTLNLEGTTAHDRITGAVTGDLGSTVNVNGTFTTENTFSVDAFKIASTGVFNMAHGVTATSGVSNDGTLSVAAGNTATITGNYTQTATGIFQTGATSAANYGKLVVTGTADLTASNKIDVKVSPGDTLANGNVLRVLSAGTVNAGTLIVTDNSAMWDFTGAVNGNAIDLTTQQVLTFQQALTYAEAVSGGAVPAAAGVAGALDVIQAAGPTGDMSTVLNELTRPGATEAEIAAGVAQLMPGFTGGSAHIAQGLASSGGSRVVHEHLAGGAQGLSSGEPMFQDRMLWAQPFYSWTDQGERKGVAGYNANSYGIALGADGKVDEQWRVGAALSFAKGDVDGDSPVTRESLDINTYQLTLYASDRLSEATSLNLQAGFGINNNDSSRHIVFGGIDRIASGDFSSWHTLLDAELEHRYKMSEKATLAAYLRGQYSYVKVEDYTETGAGAINLHMDSNSEDSLVLSVGGKAAYAVADGVKLTGHLGAGYDLMASQSSVTATFTGGGPTFVTNGLDSPAFVMQGGFGFEMLNANGLTITARYDVDGREDYTNQTATINFRLPF